MPTQSNYNPLTQGPVAPALLRFALPFLVANLLQSLYGAVDLYAVGAFSGSAAVSAVSIGAQVMQTVTGLVQGLATGGTVLIGRRIGEEQPELAGRAVGSLTVLLAGVAVVLTPVMLLCTGGVLSVMDTPAEAVSEATRYLLICSAGIPFIIGYNAVAAVFRGSGDSRTPVYFIALACAVNVAGDFLLTGALGWGAAGAAAATVLAQAVSFLACLAYMARRGLSFPICRSDFRPRRDAVGYIVRVGSPLAIQDALINVSFLVITAIINGLGLVASAAVGVVERIIGFSMMPPAAFSAAVATVTAQNMGAGKPDRARKALLLGIGFSLIVGTAFFIYVQFLPETLTAIFSRDPAVITAGGQYLRTYAADSVLVCFVFCLNSYFSGCGKSMVSFVHSMIATFGVRIPLTWYMSRQVTDSLLPMGLAAPAATLLSLAICAVYLLHLRRRTQTGTRL